jgi:predicted nucleic acid-binding protein
LGVLIDTCIWIEVEQGRLSPGDVASITREQPVYISPVTIAELKYGAEVAATPALRQKRLAALRRLQRKPLLAIDGQTGEIFGDLAAAVRQAGGQPRHRVQDLWLASQAIQHGYRLLTRNARDFAGIPGLETDVVP